MDLLPSTTTVNNEGSSRSRFLPPKHRLRACFRIVSLLGLLAGYALFHATTTQTTSHDGLVNVSTTRRQHDVKRAAAASSFLRHLEETTTATKAVEHNNDNLQDVPASEAAAAQQGATADECADLKKSPHVWQTVLYILGVLYLFLALAVVCDDFFVPALEEMSSERRLNLSMDVAGATLMAAGGSAPELFTALFGTFQESAVGFGTIVGSAVFNVLFVIGMCSLLSKEVLQLTWWPLFRDSIYYVFGLGVLAFFVAINSPGEIQLYEAIILFVMYIGYVVIMLNNRRLQTFLTRCSCCCKRGSKGESGGSGSGNNNNANTQLDDTESISRQDSSNNSPDFRWPGTFRAGVVKLIIEPQSWATKTGVGLVVKLKGDVNDAYRHCDKNGDGSIDFDEFRSVVKEMNLEMDDKEEASAFAEIDANGSGEICQQEFMQWYMNSEKHVLASIKQVFDQFDTNNSGTIDSSEVKALLETVEPNATDQDVQDAMIAMHREGSREEISYEEFSDWYLTSIVYQKQKLEAEEEMKGIFASLKPPRKCGVFSFLKYILLLPLLATLAFTIPDVRRPKLGKWCYLSFLLSISWIGVFSYFMVNWAEIIGNTFGIPAIVMGLTFLAAGTSVPDLLSSVIVARRGEGDMAVSSSVGSNIFDILVGLPLPWIAYTAYPGKPSTVKIGSDGVGPSIGILVAMIVLIIITIHLNKWRLTKLAGGMMFVFYVGFLVQAIFQEMPFQLC